MSPRFPPRREPRILALARSFNGVHYAVADPWELRSSGTLRYRRRSRRAALVRLVRREKPTALATRDDTLRPALLRVSSVAHIDMVRQSVPTIPPTVAVELYPELPLRAPTPALASVARLAIAAVLHADTHPRRYAPRRNPSPERSA